MHKLKHTYSYFVIVLSVCLMLQACAQMGEPNGGLADTSSPELISEKTFPKNKSVNITNGPIILMFNEYVQVKKEQVIITPALAAKPDIKVKGRKVQIEFTQPLEANTTYTINFSGAVQDITEANTVQNTQYMFSTGNFLDSLFIEGKVLNAFTQQPIGATTVVLHANTNDTAIAKIKPAYFLKTHKDGTFRFENLKQGTYTVFALNDKNTDLCFNGYPEEIAFLDTILTISAPVKDLNLIQFMPLSPKNGIKATTYKSKYVQEYALKKPLLKGRVVVVSQPTAWECNLLADTLVYAVLRDTTITDTLWFDVYEGETKIEKQAFTAHLSKKTAKEIKVRTIFPTEYYVSDSLFFGVNMPFEIDAQKIKLVDTLHKKEIPFVLTEHYNGFSLRIKPLQDKIPIKIACEKGFVSSQINNTRADSVVGQTTLLPEEKSGTIKVTLKPNAVLFKNAVCVLLYNNQKIKTAKADETQTLLFEQLKPGNYTLYIFNDADQNQKWSTGDFSSKKQPEEVKWFNQTIKVKANWQQEITWVF